MNFYVWDDFFWYGETDMRLFLEHPCQGKGGLVLFCTKGEAVISTGIQENNVIVNTEMTILPGVTFCLLRASDDFKVRAFTFSKELYDEVSFRLSPSFSMHLRHICTYTHTSGDMFYNNCCTFMDMAKVTYHDKMNEYRILMQRNFVQSYLMYLLDKCRHRFENLINKYSRRQELFMQFLSLLDIYCQEQHDVAFYAEKLCITPRYLAMVTAECSSFESPKEVIDKRLILEIKVLLQATEMNIQEIANKLYFSDLSYFGRYFKRHTGLSATEYRNK